MMDNKDISNRLLIIDDDQLVLRSFKAILEKEGYVVITANSGKKAIELISNERFNLILTDLMMVDVGGIDVLKEAKKVDPDAVVVIVTGFESMETALEAMRHGAYDYLIKPCDEYDLKITVNRGLEKQAIEKKLLEVEKLAAITETAIKTGHEIKIPLETIFKELDILLKKSETLKKETMEGINILSKEAKRIKKILEKLSQITRPVIIEYIGDIKMVDIDKSLFNEKSKKS